MGFAASPFCPDNEIVLSGYKTPDGEVRQFHVAHDFPQAKLYVGCNIKFDLLWAARYARLTPAQLVEGARVWDVSLAEYILKRQRSRMPSLDDCAEAYGLASHKHSPVALAIKNGTCPSAIAVGDLLEYHASDLHLTEAVFLKQFEEAKVRGMLPLIWSQMQALVATCEMEHHGILIDRIALGKLEVEYSKTIEARSAQYINYVDNWSDGRIVDICETMMRVPGALEVGSNKWLSLLLFGGTVTVKEKIPAGTFKNGKPKTKLTDVEYKFKGLGCDPKKLGAELNKLGYYTVDDAVLKSIEEEKDGSTGGASLIAPIVRQWREANKQLTTYVDGVRQNIWPDGKVHCSFNHNVTLTGRLSCSSPNLQNQTDGPIKAIYVPDPGWYFVEFDYSQLEVVGLAVLSGDTQLLHDIRSGVDIHATLFEAMYARAPTVAERKAFKPLTFGLIYGAGAKTLAENSGRPVSEAKLFITTFYDRYKQVAVYHSRILSEAKAGRTASAHKTEAGFPAGVFVYRTATGREYEFREYDSLGSWSASKTSFSPTELKNWPIQGFSTGDVVPLMVGHVVAEVLKSKYREVIRPVVTVHDSIMFMIKGLPEDTEELRNFLVALMSDTRQVISDRFGFDIGLELKTEHKIGNNWKEMR